MEPQQQVPQQPSNQGTVNSAPAYESAAGGMKKSFGAMKVIIILVVIAIIGVIAYMMMKNNAPAAEQTSGLSAEQSAAMDTQLTQLEQENDADDFSSIDTDFGADVNAAAQ
jgi:uncharacterized protein HemX